MNGVEILNYETIYNTVLPEVFIVIGFFGLFIFLMVGFACLANDSFVGFVVCFILMACFMVTAILGATDNKNSINHFEYQVTVDESVSMTEFLDKYEIIDQEGKIYTVRERQ